MGLGLHKNNRLYSNSDSESDSDDPDTNILTDSINENDVPDELLKMTPLNNENSFLKLFGY